MTLIVELTAAEMKAIHCLTLLLRRRQIEETIAPDLIEPAMRAAEAIWKASIILDNDAE